jgi:radical SAM protein with 4Fe4S-binding SPASM domain
MAEVLTKRLPTHPLRRPDGTLDYRPMYVVWEITLRCDQACHFCGSRAGAARTDELSTREALDVIEQLAAMGTREVALHGGEAYLRDDFLTLIRAIRDHGMDPTMVTGGRGFTAQLAVDAAAAGIQSVSLSIDGLAPTHEALRGLRGGHGKAIEALQNLLNAGVKVGCNTQLNRKNFRELPELADLLMQFPLYGWQVQLMVPMGRAAEATDLWLQPYDLLELIPIVAAVRQRCETMGLKLWPGDNVGYFGPYEHVLRDKRTPSGHSGGCGGGVLTLGIESHGDIKGCSAMSSEGFVAGNVRSARIQQVWDKAPELRFMRDFKLDDLWGFCRDCYYAEVCRGGCVWTAATLLGKRGNNPYCHHRAIEKIARGKRERLIQVRPAAGLVRDRALFELVEQDAPTDWVATLPALPGGIAYVRGGASG